MEERTETELVNLARAGDADAFCQLVERCQVVASVLAFRFIANPEMVREVVQEATLQAFLSLDRLRDATRFKSWFYGIVFNICRTWLREQGRGVLSLDALTTEWQSAALSPLHVLADPYEIVEEQELRQFVQEAVQELSPNTRRVIWLFYYEQVSMQGIATHLAISLSAVKNRLYKGRNELRKYLMVAYPEIEARRSALSGKRRRKPMIQVTLAQVIPQPRHTIIVLRDVQGQRLLPLRLLGREEYLLAVHFLTSSHQDAFPSDPSLIPVEFTEQVLHAIGESIEEVQIDALQNTLLPYATVRLRLAASLHEIKTRVGVALFVAQQVHCPIVVSEDLLRELAISPPPETESQEHQLTRLLAARLPMHPRNLDFQDGTNGWYFGEGPSQHFDYGIDLQTASHRKASVFLKTKQGGSKGKGWVGQAFLADDYRGKRLRLSGLLKTEHVEGATGVFLRAEGVNETLRSANMQQQPLQGTQDWTPCALEIDVPTESISLALGLLLLGMGQVWLTDMHLEVVSEDTLSPH